MPSEYRTASIGTNHAMILPRDTNLKPDGIFGKDRHEFFIKNLLGSRQRSLARRLPTPPP